MRKGELDVNRACVQSPLRQLSRSQQRAYGKPLYYLIQNSWYVHTGIKNSIRDVLNWIYDIMK